MIKKVKIKHYKSIKQADVDLTPLTVLVGPNGAGKSNFIDALSFVTDCLVGGLELAFKTRGGIDAVRRKSGGHPTDIGIGLTLEFEKDALATYAFEIAAGKSGSFNIKRERCSVYRKNKPEARFEVEKGRFVEQIKGIAPKIEADRLALYAASAIPDFRSVYDFLQAMRFYSIVPNELRELQDPDPGNFLKRDGSNAAAVLKRIGEVSGQNGEPYERVCRLLAKIVPGLQKAEYKAFAQKETIRFKRDVGLKDPWTFDALNMSDGTLRVLGILLAVFQPSKPAFMAIEEPEATVHPAVSEVLLDVLIEGSKKTQILFSTHSPDIIDNKALDESWIRAVESKKGATFVSPLSESNRKAIKEKLYTAGELLRVNELSPDPKTFIETPRLELFREKKWSE